MKSGPTPIGSGRRGAGPNQPEERGPLVAGFTPERTPQSSCSTAAIEILQEAMIANQRQKAEKSPEISHLSQGSIIPRCAS